MNPIGFAIAHPVTVLVGVILVVLFGGLAALGLPVQLTPDVDRPVITVTTFWEGATPQEVEQDVVDKQEERLKGVEGLVKMTSRSLQGMGEITLEFAVGQDLSRALLDVNEKLRQVPSYPENVDQPVLSAGETEHASAIAWFTLQRLPGSPIAEEDVPRLQTLMEEEVKPLLERASGVANVALIGGVERELHVRVDPELLAARQLTFQDVRAALSGRNLDLSAGSIDRGKHSVAVRGTGRFASLEAVEGLVLARREGRPVFLRDVGSAAIGYKKPMAAVRSMGAPAIAMNATRQAGTNVIAVMASLKQALGRANREILGPRGLQVTQVYDQTDYIHSAVDLVAQNLYVGGALAMLVLLVFLRRVRSTLIVGVAIPVSVIGSFLGLSLMGRNLNVVSLAGLAFAVGMVVDNSIVVLENIHRRIQTGERPFEAALRGAREVWGAVVASTLTTLVVFVPVIFMRQEAGQLFRDIAIAISSAVFVSLLVSVLFIPSMGARFMGGGNGEGGRRNLLGGLLGLAALAGGFTRGVAGIAAWFNRGIARRLLFAGGLSLATVAAALLLFPPASYLPGGNQNLVFGYMIPPPGYSIPEFERIARGMEARLEPYWKADPDRPLPPELARPAWYAGREPLPALKSFFFVAFGSVAFMGASSADPENVRPLQDLLRHAGGDVPGVLLFSLQASLFESGLSSGNSIDLEISGSDFGAIQQAAGALFGSILQSPDFQDPQRGPTPPRPEPPSLNLGAPEFRVRADEARAAELGLSMRDIGFILRTLVDGSVVGDYRDRGVNIDLKLLGGGNRALGLEELGGVPLFTPAGRQVPLSAVAALEEATAPSEIRRSEKRRAVMLVVTPPPGLELSRAMELLEQKIIAPLVQAGAIPPGVSATLAGTADKLVTTRIALQGNFLLAIVISYLLMAALFESFLYPLIILFSVPLAAIGGVAGLRIVHELTGQQMDVLTMLGFIILVGTVVNNAILIVHQALNNMREQGLDSKAAVVLSVRTRVRPIFMSTLTSVFGMLPLVFFPGSGSELYRGLGSVVVGGLVTATLFTLFLIPVLFTLTVEARGALARLLGGALAREPGRER